MKEENKSIEKYLNYVNSAYYRQVALNNSTFDDVVDIWHNEQYNQIIAKDCSDKIYQNEPAVSLETKPEVSPYMILI